MNMPLFHQECKITLRRYQETAVTETRMSVSKHKKVLLKLPTGSGKSHIGAFIIKRAAENGLRCGFIVETIQLINQTLNVFSQHGINNVGVIQGDHPLWNPEASVQIASVQTLARRSVEKFDFLIIDEAHVLHEKHKELIDEADYVVGLSATPYRKGLGRYYKDLIAPISMRELIDAGHLVDFKVYGPRTINTEGLKTVAGDFVEKEIAERADKSKITGDIVDHWLKYGKGRKTICFCCNVAHGKHVAQAFNKVGVKAVEVNSYQNNIGENNERKENMDSFVFGSADVICSVDILGKGFDFPDASCCILARPTKSLMVHQQQVGRVLRVGGWEDALILDHAGNNERLGFVDEIEINSLDNGEKKKSEVNEKEKDEPLPKACPSCDFVKPAKVHKCPACGFEPENIRDVETEEGELEEIKRVKKDRKEYSVVEKTEFMGGLNTYYETVIIPKRGWILKPNGIYKWSLDRYQDKFGCMPSSKTPWGQKSTISEDVSNFIKHCSIRFAKSEAGKKWAAENNKKQPETKKSSCKKCGSGHIVRTEGLWGPHKIKLTCGQCKSFIDWGKSTV